RSSNLYGSERRSSSAIDRTDTRGRRGRLFWSVIAAERGASDRHLPHRPRSDILLASFTIYKGGKNCPGTTGSSSIRSAHQRVGAGPLAHSNSGGRQRGQL